MASILAKRKELPGGGDGPLKKRRFRRPMSTAASESTPSGEGSTVGAPPATSETPGRIVSRHAERCKKIYLKFLDRYNRAEKKKADQMNMEDVAAAAAAVEEEAAAESMVEQHMVNVEEPWDRRRRANYPTPYWKAHGLTATVVHPIPYWKAHDSTATVNDEVDGDDSGNKDGKGANGGDKDGDRSNKHLKPTPGQVKIGAPSTNKKRRRRRRGAARASKKNQNKSGSTEFRVNLPLPSNRYSRYPHNHHKPSSVKLAPLVQRKGSRGEVPLRQEERNTYCCAGGLHVLDALHYALGAEGTTILLSEEDCKRTPQFCNKGYIDFAVLHHAMSDKKLPYLLVKNELADLSPFKLLQLPGGIYLVRVKLGTKGGKKEDHFICVNTWTKWIFYPDQNPEMCHVHYSDSDTASRKAANKVMDGLGITEICQARLVQVVLEHAPSHHR